MTKKSSKKLLSNAARVLTDSSSSGIQRLLAASVLSQGRPKAETSEEVEKIAAKVLGSEKYSDLTKSLAGSALSQSN